MEIITKNNRKYYRFKIGDEFKAISGKGSFNKMKKEGLCSDTYNEEQGFIYPCLDASSSNNHIKGYCKEYNYDGKAIKVTIAGDSGLSRYIYKKIYNLENSDLLVSKQNLEPNYYIGIFFNKFLPYYKQGTAITKVLFSYYKDEYIEIPINHEELSRVIKRILEYKQISKQISKQMKDYKLAILQESEKSIKHWKETNQHDKYSTFKIGDEFTSLRGKGSYNKMLKEGICSDTYNEEQGFIYPFYTSQASNEHVVGYCKEYNISHKHIKISADGEGTAGLSIYSSINSYCGAGSIGLKSNTFCNSYCELKMKSLFWGERQGTAVKHVYFRDISQLYITVPKNHNELSKKIEQLNKWQIKVEETVKQMEEYIEGILQMSLK